MQTPSRLDKTPIEVPRGLANVIVTETALSDVRGTEGFYHYRQYSAIELAEHRSLEEVWFLLMAGNLPSAGQLQAFTARIAAQSRLSVGLQGVLPRLAANGDYLAGLKAALAFESITAPGSWGVPLFDLDRDARSEALLALAARVPVIIAALHRLRRGSQPIPADPELGYVANYLYMLNGVRPDPAHADALGTYLVAAVDHGLNASTFTARVIASTGADAVSCLLGALGSLSGPLHGGAPSRALDTLDAIGSLANIDPWITEQVLAGHRIMGFGHPVYRTEDPRSALLKSVALRFGGPRVDFAVAVEERIPQLLAQLKPGRELHTNLEFYAAIVMEICGLDRALFTPTFAVARVLGWCANIIEQCEDPKIIRPTARYVGPAAPQPLP
ncbi:citrate/2-methylcitrate synthase [Arthrobacter russicus]|jgi:citrate synthase|uniref:Citrate synthase n=1 Tax=Arthrobacter russicus TaxID=172040 RepID=A0ABU1JCB1_9MICC|nr:citrate/2-methylcitrate synthase [Arthrobacter russicus]MDN5668172.1 citrate synthase/methylcitrate synthase [Renibacterium salmoninarum]MDR6269789.1 citrate synthase [Arthrobacter russicus]